jgi:hypothetical protein
MDLPKNIKNRDNYNFIFFLAACPCLLTTDETRGALKRRSLFMNPPPMGKIHKQEKGRKKK